MNTKQTTTVTTGHTDQLPTLSLVETRSENKITKQDRLYCQHQQDRQTAQTCYQRLRLDKITLQNSIR